MKTQQQLLEWCQGAAAQFKDPAEPVGQSFIRLVPALKPPPMFAREAIETEGPIEAAYYKHDYQRHRFPRHTLMLDLPDGHYPVRFGVWTSRWVPSDEVRVLFNVVPVVPGVWYLTPSFNHRGVLHTFITLYDVPEPAPWMTR